MGKNWKLLGGRELKYAVTIGFSSLRIFCRQWEGDMPWIRRNCRLKLDGEGYPTWRPISVTEWLQLYSSTQARSMRTICT